MARRKKVDDGLCAFTHTLKLRAHYVCRRLVQPRPSMLPSLEDCRMHDGPFRDTRINAVYNPVNFTETECE